MLFDTNIGFQIFDVVRSISRTSRIDSKVLKLFNFGILPRRKLGRQTICSDESLGEIDHDPWLLRREVRRFALIRENKKINLLETTRSID